MKPLAGKIFLRHLAGENGSQSIGSATGRMLLIQGAHVRRTHGAFEFFSALAHTAAHFYCSCETALRAEIQGGLRYPSLVLRMDLERLGHGRCIDNFSGVEPIV